MRKLTFGILCLEGAVLSFNVAATAAVVPSVAKEFVLSQFLVGAAVWLYMIPYGCAALLYGPLVRRFDAKKVELIALLLFSLANFLAAYAHSIAWFFLARFLMGVFGASVIPLALILIARESKAGERGKMVGGFFSATFVASLAGLLLSGVLPWRLIYLIPALSGMLLWAAMFLFLPSFRPERAGAAFHYGRALADPKVRAVFTYIFCVSIAYHGIQQWLAVYFSTRFGLDQFLVSMLVTLTSASGIVGEVAGGFMADSIGRRRTIDAGLVVMACCIFLLLCNAPVWLLAGLMVAWGLGWTFNHAGISTVLTDLPQQYLHEAASLNSSVRFISGGVGAAAGGALMQRSFQAGFLTFGIVLAALFMATHIRSKGERLWIQW